MIVSIVLSCLFLVARPNLADALNPKCCATCMNIGFALRPFYTGATDAAKKSLDLINEAARCCPVVGPLGMAGGRIKDSFLSASSSYKQSTHGPHRARPTSKGYAGSWSAAKDDTSPWIQVSFYHPVKITGVVTQGRSDGYNQWVSRYQVACSQDGKKWYSVANEKGTKTFVGNSDSLTPVTNSFQNMVYAQYLRIGPTEWNNYPSLRFEVLGCRLTGQ